MAYKDYRLPTASTDFDNLQKKKKELVEHLSSSNHSRAVDHYSLYGKEKGLKQKFFDTYKKRCSYCGTSAGLFGVENLEIDHFVCKADSDATQEVFGFGLNHTYNLVSSCPQCNRSKSDLSIPEQYRDIVNPDQDTIKVVFQRDENFKIQIAPEYKSDEFVNKLYQKLQLNSYIHQLDYLISEIEELAKKEEAPETVKDKLYKASLFLRTKRNCTYK